jgi:tRNA U34 2-thiouridine synthase MnmA/TrmU
LPTHRALGLLSGGLDSALAARLLIDQGLEVVGLHLESPTACRSDVREVAGALGIRLEVRPKGEEYLRLLRSPRFGYGKNMNPCIDCRVFMFHIAKQCMDDVGAEFVFTGEVVGQRPMSQARNTLTLIDAEAGLQNRIVRPLSAKLLPMTEPERQGLLDRERLLSISGRGRETQLALADRLGLAHYESPGGGCLLTDANFSVKLRDLFEHVPEERTTLEDVRLLRLGRHFRVRDDLKIVLGRNREENLQLKTFANTERWLLEPENWNGPNALVCGPRGERSLQEALVLMARYSRSPEPHHTVHWHEDGQERRAPLGALAQSGSEVGAGRA